ncbi:hypothetical protein DL96DRAFT_1607583 [Flagelloscypha sp. PMI_526]|nr:hypothetical protein DL96DRAFT_1607583 [Flagelloscypha sp. PMI_526]
MVSPRFSTQEVVGPFGLLSRRPCFPPKDKAAVEQSLRNGSTIPELSGQDLADAATEFRKHFLEIQRDISKLQVYITALNYQAKELQSEEDLAKAAGCRLIQPFPPPPLPVDIAEQIISIAAGEDKPTAKSFSLVSKQFWQWARSQLWKSVFVDTYKLDHFINLLHDLGSECLTEEDICTHPSLRHISCDPHIFTRSPESEAFNSPFFQDMTHIDVTGGANDFVEWSSWNWDSLKELPHLTHLRVDMWFLQRDLTQVPCIPDRLIPALPPSIQIVILDIQSDTAFMNHELYDKIRCGHLDQRILLCVFKEPHGIMDGRKWLKGGDDRLWMAGMDMMRKRNAALGVQSANNRNHVL